MVDSSDKSKKRIRFEPVEHTHPEHEKPSWAHPEHDKPDWSPPEHEKPSWSAPSWMQPSWQEWESAPVDRDDGEDEEAVDEVSEGGSTDESSEPDGNETESSK